LIGFVCALGTLAIWWDSNLDEEKLPRPGWLEWFVQLAASGGAALMAWLDNVIPAQERWRETSLFPHRAALLPAVALLSLAGAPFTIGASSRWSLYGRLLETSEAAQLVLVMIADTLLIAGLWMVFRQSLDQASQRRPGAAALVAMASFAVLMVVIGVSPGLVTTSLGQAPIAEVGVSVLGLGLIYVLPWVLGFWLARAGIYQSPYLGYVRDALSLDWLFRAGSWIGQQFGTGIYWLGRVGEGDGWWGWALIILALGAIFLSSR
jgi:hypothetical protein